MSAPKKNYDFEEARLSEAYLVVSELEELLDRARVMPPELFDELQQLVYSTRRWLRRKSIELGGE